MGPSTRSGFARISNAPVASDDSTPSLVLWPCCTASATAGGRSTRSSSSFKRPRFGASSTFGPCPPRAETRSSTRRHSSRRSRTPASSTSGAARSWEVSVHLVRILATWRFGMTRFAGTPITLRRASSQTASAGCSEAAASCPPRSCAPSPTGAAATDGSSRTRSSPRAAASFICSTASTRNTSFTHRRGSRTAVPSLTGAFNARCASSLPARG
jgi:hypothetical protein